jgi:hypothetical protein
VLRFVKHIGDGSERFPDVALAGSGSEPAEGDVHRPMVHSNLLFRNFSMVLFGFCL